MKKHDHVLAESLRIPMRAAFLAETLGDRTALADLLEVDADQLNRWINGEEAPGQARARQVLDLDHMVALASLVWEPEVLRSWLVGGNMFLDGARPTDVMKARGSGDVLEALEAEMQLALG